MFVERYWRIAVAAIPIGFTLGAALFGLVALTGNPDWRANLSAAEVLRSISSYGAVGAVVALGSLAGGGVTTALADPPLRHRPARRILAAGIGAGAAVLALGAAISAIDGQQPTVFYLALFIALPAGVTASALVAVAERRASRTPTHSSTEPPTR